MNSVSPEATSQSQSNSSSDRSKENDDLRQESDEEKASEKISDSDEPVTFSQKSVEEIQNEPKNDDERLRRSTILQRLSRPPVQQYEFPTPDFKRYQEKSNEFVPANLGRYQN